MLQSQIGQYRNYRSITDSLCSRFGILISRFMYKFACIGIHLLHFKNLTKSTSGGAAINLSTLVLYRIWSFELINFLYQFWITNHVTTPSFGLPPMYTQCPLPPQQVFGRTCHFSPQGPWGSYVRNVAHFHLADFDIIEICQFVLEIRLFLPPIYSKMLPNFSMRRCVGPFCFKVGL